MFVTLVAGVFNSRRNRDRTATNPEADSKVIVNEKKQRRKG